MIYLSSVYRAGSGWERSIRYQFDGPLEEAIHWMRQERAKYPTVILIRAPALLPATIRTTMSLRVAVAK